MYSARTEVIEMDLRAKFHAIVLKLLSLAQRGDDRDYGCEFGEHGPECNHRKPWAVVRWLFSLEAKLTR